MPSPPNEGTPFLFVVTDLIKGAGPFSLLCLAAGGLGVMLAIVTLVLTAKKSKAANVAGVLSLLLSLSILGLGLAGFSLSMSAVTKALALVPDDVKDALLHKGTQEARANFVVALTGAVIPLLVGALTVIVRRLKVGMVLMVAVTIACVAMLVALMRPLPPKGPKVATVPGLELPTSSASRELGAQHGK